MTKTINSDSKPKTDVTCVKIEMDIFAILAEPDGITIDKIIERDIALSRKDQLINELTKDYAFSILAQRPALNKKVYALMTGLYKKSYAKDEIQKILNWSDNKISYAYSNMRRIIHDINASRYPISVSVSRQYTRAYNRLQRIKELIK